MESKRASSWSSFVAFFMGLMRFFGRKGSGPKAQKFSYDYPAGPRPARLNRNAGRTVRRFSPRGGNRWWRRQMSMRGRFADDWGREMRDEDKN